MKEPVLSDESLLADIDAVRRRAGILDLWWLGQSGFLIQHRGRWVLVDPYLSDSLTSKYANTDRPHVRMSRRVIDPGNLAQHLFVPMSITSSHAHTDHFDPDTLKGIVDSWCLDKLIAPKSERQKAIERSTGQMGQHQEHSPPAIELADDGTRHQLGAGIMVHGIASAHETVERDAEGFCKFLGYVFEFHPSSVTANGEAFVGDRELAIYHSGDTILYDGLVEKLRPFNIDVALLPINGRAPERRVAGNLWGREAAWLAKQINAKLVIPCHYDMFEFNTATPDEFVAECQRLNQLYRVLQLGERWSSSELNLQENSSKKQI